MVPDRGGSRWPYWRHRDAAAKNPRWRGPLRGRRWASSKRCPTRLIRLTDMTNPYKLDSIYSICTYVLYVNLSQSLSIYKAQQILLGMSMPCDAMRCHWTGRNRGSSTMLHHALPFLTLFYAFGCLRHVHCIAHLVACNSLQPALKHQHVLQRSSLQARNDAIRGIIDFIHGDGLNTAILRILRAMCRTTGIWERCNFRWMHQFTQVYTVENGKRERQNCGWIQNRTILSIPRWSQMQ